MDTLYEIMEKLLPFSWVEYNFMKNALIAIVIITPFLFWYDDYNTEWRFFRSLGHSALQV